MPANASTVKTKRPWINAKVETLRSKGGYFGVALDAAHRALILADGFYEWPTPEDKKATSKLKPPPIRFTVDGGRVFCFAGLWVTACHIEDGPVTSCTIITCDATANRVVAPVHDRMPVILADPDLMKAWLDPAISPAEALSLCEPLPSERMSASKAIPAAVGGMRRGYGGRKCGGAKRYQHRQARKESDGARPWRVCAPPAQRASQAVPERRAIHRIPGPPPPYVRLRGGRALMPHLARPLLLASTRCSRPGLLCRHR